MVKVNGSEYDFGDMNLLDVIKQFDLNQSRIVVEVNYEIISQDKYANYVVQHGDNIEIVQFVGGG